MAGIAARAANSPEWPDLGRDELAGISEFHSRERRFGRVPVGAPRPTFGHAVRRN